MKIFAYSVGTSVPKSNLFDKFKAQSIIRERKSSIEDRIEVGKVHQTVELIECPSYDWHIQMITSENLGWLINEVIAARIIFRNMSIYFREIHLWNPGVSINNSNENLIEIETIFIQKLLFQMFSTP
jgi:hypothetical protein